MTRMLTIIPTRGRNDNAIRLFEAINATADFTEVVFAIDADDVKTYQGLMHETVGLDNVKVVIAEHMGLNATLNHWALWFAPDYDYIGFLGDDVIPRTGGWDTKLAEAIGTNAGIAYGNDLYQSEKLPTHPVMSSKIIRATGFFAPPTLKHLFLDNYWLAMGEALGNLQYLPDVILEHMHYVNGKAPFDERYAAVNGPEKHERDQAMFAEYIIKEFMNDVENVKAW